MPGGSMHVKSVPARKRLESHSEGHFASSEDRIRTTTTPLGYELTSLKISPVAVGLAVQIGLYSAVSLFRRVAVVRIRFSLFPNQFPTQQSAAIPGRNRSDSWWTTAAPSPPCGRGASEGPSITAGASVVIMVDKR